MTTAESTVPELERRTIRKVALRLLPFLGLLYFINYLDRINIGFAKLTMSDDLGLTADRVRARRPASSSSATCCSRCRATWPCTGSAPAAGSPGS